MAGSVVIGIGHRDRGDDAFGRIVAQQLRLRAPHLRVLDHDGEATTLVDWLGMADRAIVVDAALSGAAPGTVHRFDVANSALPYGKFSLSSHGLGLAEAIELARTLRTLPAGCVVDGEIVIATPHGLDFDALQLRLHPAAFVC